MLFFFFFVHIHSMTNHIQLVNVDPARSEQILVGNSVIIAKIHYLYIIIFNTYSVFCLKKETFGNCYLDDCTA